MEVPVDVLSRTSLGLHVDGGPIVPRVGISHALAGGLIVYRAGRRVVVAVR